MKKFLIAFASVFVLCVPAFAADSHFANPLDCSLGSFSFPNNDGAFCCVIVGNQYIVFGCSESSSSTFTKDGVSYTTSSQLYGDVYANGVGNYGIVDNFIPSIEVYPNGTSYADIALDFLGYINNPSSINSSSFTLPCGNVLYFQVTSEQDVTLSAQMPQLSYLVQFGNNAYGPWGDTGIEYGPAASLPTSGTTFPILSMDPVQWAKGEPKNILGQSKVGVATKHCIVGQWYALFCPLTSPQVLDASTGDHAMGASVVVSGSFSQIKVYPLSETLDYDNPLGATYESGSNDGYDSYFDGSSDENGTVTWTNQDGQVQAPQSGGTNYVSPAANAESLLSQIRQLLANIVSELKSLFTFGYEAVQDLVGIMRDFVNVLGGLYTWLPAEVYSALMSAVVVAIVIGVFKVFL